MYKAAEGPYTLLLLLCVAGSLWSSTADGTAVTDSSVPKKALQDLTAQATATKPTVSGFTPYPEFIGGQTPSRAPQQPPEAAGRCSPALQCSNTAAVERLEARHGLATPAASGDSVQHAAAEPTTQQAAQQQPPPSHVQQQHAATAATAPATAAQPPAAAAPSPEAQQPILAPLTAQEPTTAILAATAVSQQQPKQPPPPPPPVRRLLNLALLSDGATVLAANPEARRPERAIDKDIDSFMKNDCNADKWVMIELSQLGTVETVKLTMKELYSSRVHTFRIFGRSSHPRKDGPDLTASITADAWQLLGTFTAENKRGTQSFTLPQRSRVRYILLRFDTHYGSEAMCALNVIEVLGVSAAQELEEALALQEELEAEELFQHLQQQYEQEEQMQQQLQPLPPKQPQQPTAASSGAGAGGPAPPVSNDSALVAVTQQSQDDSSVVQVDVAGIPGQEAQQLSPQSSAISAELAKQQDPAVDRSSGLRQTTETLGPSTGVQQQQQPPAASEVQDVGTDQDIIAVPIVPDPTTQTAAASEKQAISEQPQQQVVDAAGGVAPSPAGLTITSQTSNGGPPSGTAGPIAGGMAPQQQQLVVPMPPSPAQPTPPAQPTGQQQSHPAVAQPAVQTSSAAHIPATPAVAGLVAGGAVRTEVLANGQVFSGRAGDATHAAPAATNGQTAPQPPSAGQPSSASAAAPAGPLPAQPASPPKTAPQQPSTQAQQLPAAAAPSQQQPQPKQAMREPVLVGGTAKPKQAGNLFDIIKSEMMQLKLEQNKVSKKLEGLSKRGTEHDALAMQLQEQQVQLVDRVETLTLKVDSLADQLSRAEVVFQYNMQGDQQHAGGMQGRRDPVGDMPHGHRAQQHLHSAHVASGTSPAGPRHMPVCQGEVIPVPQMLQSCYMCWGVVGLLAGSALLGLMVLLLHPSVPKLSSAIKFVILALALLNLLLAVLLCMYLLLEGLLGRYQQAFLREYMFDTFVTVPHHRMITNGSQ